VFCSGFLFFGCLFWVVCTRQHGSGGHHWHEHDEHNDTSVNAPTYPPAVYSPPARDNHYAYSSGAGYADQQQAAVWSGINAQGAATWAAIDAQSASNYR